MLTETQITKFQEIYLARTGESISREQSYERGIKLITLLQIIYKPMRMSDMEDITKRINQLK